MAEQSRNGSAPIVLVPGFWLGAWAWDEVAGILRAEGHDVTAITLPGLESADADRSGIGFRDHVDAVVDAVEAKDAPVVLAVHSASGFTGYAASDRVPERIAAMVYVDSAPGISPQDPDLQSDEQPMIWDEIKEQENLDGLSEEQLRTFRERAVPVPGGVLRDTVPLTNDARKDIPSTFICTAFPATEIQKAAREHDWAWLAGIAELRNVSWLDLPTSHWPMWSRPADLAAIIGDVATAHGPGA
jgi:pimeloyl-ACP methyl ester carboxylesterase